MKDLVFEILGGSIGPVSIIYGDHTGLVGSMNDSAADLLCRSAGYDGGVRAGWSCSSKPDPLIVKTPTKYRVLITSDGKHKKTMEKALESKLLSSSAKTELTSALKGLHNAEKLLARKYMGHAPSSVSSQNQPKSPTPREQSFSQQNYNGLSSRESLLRSTNFANTSSEGTASLSSVLAGCNFCQAAVPVVISYIVCPFQASELSSCEYRTSQTKDAEIVSCFRKDQLLSRINYRLVSWSGDIVFGYSGYTQHRYQGEWRYICADDITEQTSAYICSALGDSLASFSGVKTDSKKSVSVACSNISGFTNCTVKRAYFCNSVLRLECKNRIAPETLKFLPSLAPLLQIT